MLEIIVIAIVQLLVGFYCGYTVAVINQRKAKRKQRHYPKVEVSWTDTSSTPMFLPLNEQDKSK